MNGLKFPGQVREVAMKNVIVSRITRYTWKVPLDATGRGDAEAPEFGISILFSIYGAV